MCYTHSAVGLKRLSLPLACWELGFVLRVAPLPAFLLLLAGHAEAVSVIRVTQSAAQRGRGRGAGRGADAKPGNSPRDLNSPPSVDR